MSAAHVLSVLVLLGSGTVAGVLFAVAVSTVPALAAMPADRYVYTHTLLGRNWDPTMPIIVLATTLLDIALAVLVTGTAARSLIIVAAVCLAGVSVVSHLCNVPINKKVHRTDPDAIPAGWHDPRPLWRRWHLLRTTLAMVALAANGLAVTLL
ncbi:hypothetical protein Misp01_18900 [Microtetraspora sp. NBRC 13810]|uniref:anthrone oxygenase family protein n=1 Tax=Microtetraspora sp. NBRC 13810 TaxID=3030990 RepID=UPI0024A338F6|nr:DUF1772 domain-containing protein [Microtetraspora sp. NBRC 13810]GLW06760.1 hypothetical protein Misp01_18900 [Microtetraspora sp. NBRC 13810]